MSLFKGLFIRIRKTGNKFVTNFFIKFHYSQRICLWQVCHWEANNSQSHQSNFNSKPVQKHSWWICLQVNSLRSNLRPLESLGSTLSFEVFHSFSSFSKKQIPKLLRMGTWGLNVKLLLSRNDSFSFKIVPKLWTDLKQGFSNSDQMQNLII